MRQGLANLLQRLASAKGESNWALSLLKMDRVNPAGTSQPADLADLFLGRGSSVVGVFCGCDIL